MDEASKADIVSKEHNNVLAVYCLFKIFFSTNPEHSPICDSDILFIRWHLIFSGERNRKSAWEGTSRQQGMKRVGKG